MSKIWLVKGLLQLISFLIKSFLTCSKVINKSKLFPQHTSSKFLTSELNKNEHFYEKSSWSLHVNFLGKKRWKCLSWGFSSQLCIDSFRWDPLMFQLFFCQTCFSNERFCLQFWYKLTMNTYVVLNHLKNVVFMRIKNCFLQRLLFDFCGVSTSCINILKGSYSLMRIFTRYIRLK